MERKYYRQYEPYKKVVPRQEDFPVLEFNAETQADKSSGEEKRITGVKQKGFLSDIKVDDILILAVLIMLLSENEKDSVTILILAFLFLSEYIF